MSGQQPAEIRASDAEREHTGEVLREATVEGRLTLDEFSERYMQAHQARTRAELDTMLHDLPAAALPSRGTPKAKLQAILSGVNQTVTWQLAPETSVNAILGGCKLDLRRATISADLTTLDVRIILGNLEMIVPEGFDIEIDAAMILSSQSVKLSTASRNRSLKPLIRITGSAYLSSITVRDAPNLGERLREVMTGLLDAPRSDQQR